jgi:predicted enzyme related to lactoylglutathione lyase
VERVLGIGGVFPRADDPEALRAWYEANLGIPVAEGRIEEQEFGRFGWAVDPEGNRFELWEPVRS